eukprot:1247973-Rhodomonas_salina.1
MPFTAAFAHLTQPHVRWQEYVARNLDFGGGVGGGASILHLEDKVGFRHTLIDNIATITTVIS